MSNKHKYQPDEVRAEIKRLLSAGDMSKKAIAQALRVSEATAFNHLTAMREEGLVYLVATGRIRWSLYPGGTNRQALDVSHWPEALRLLGGFNPHPHAPGTPIEVKSHSMGGITHKPP